MSLIYFSNLLSSGSRRRYRRVCFLFVFLLFFPFWGVLLCVHFSVGSFCLSEFFGELLLLLCIDLRLLKTHRRKLTGEGGCEGRGCRVVSHVVSRENQTLNSLNVV